MLNKKHSIQIICMALGGLALTACSHSSSSYHANGYQETSGRYAATSASSDCYADCGFYWAERIIAIPTTHTIKTEYVDREVVVEKEVVKEVVVEKEVYIDRPVQTPCPPCPTSAPCPVVQPCEPVGYPEPPKPWSPPPVMRK